MNASLMQLEALVLSSLVIEGRTLEKPLENVPLDGAHQVSYDIARHLDNPQFRLRATFTTTWDGDQPSYFQRIEVGVTGIFLFPPETPEESIAKYVPELCLANLYGAARGIVAQATALFPGGPYVLPLLNMHEVIKTAAPAVREEDAAVKKAPPKRRRKVAEAQINIPPATE